MVDFNLLVVDEASAMVEWQGLTFHFLVIFGTVCILLLFLLCCVLGYDLLALWLSSSIGGACRVEYLLADGLKVWPVQRGQIFDWTFDSKTKIWKLSFLLLIVFFCHKFPFSILFVKVKKSFGLLAFR